MHSIDSDLQYFDCNVSSWHAGHFRPVVRAPSFDGDQSPTFYRSAGC